MLVVLKTDVTGNSNSELVEFASKLENGITTFSVDEDSLSWKNLNFFVIHHLNNLLVGNYISTIDEKGNVRIIDSDNTVLTATVLKDASISEVCMYHECYTMMDLVKKVTIKAISVDDDTINDVNCCESFTMKLQFHDIVERQKCNVNYYPNLMQMVILPEEGEHPDPFASKSFLAEVKKFVRNLSEDCYLDMDKLVFKVKNGKFKIKEV